MTTSKLIDITIDRKIAQFAKETPSQIAIEHGSRNITYEQLDVNSRKIAHFLLEHYQSTKNVFVIMERSIELIESMLGVMKSGGVFVPVDHLTADDRLVSMLMEIQSDWVITTSDLVDNMQLCIHKANLKMNILVIDPGDTRVESTSTYENVYLINQYRERPENTHEYVANKHCYIYFTSGSTGKPKCILGRHKSLAHFINWEIREMEINRESRVSQFTPVSFDPFLRDVLVPLCAGGTLCIPDGQETIIHPRKLIEWIENSKITLIHMVPSLFKVMSNHIEDKLTFKNLKHILLAGELLRGNDIKKFMEVIGPRVQLVNLYGPTETTLAKFFYKIKEEDIHKAIIPVGKPIDQTQVYILNEDLQKCGKGIIGEIYIRTPFMTSGYINDRELNKIVFIRNPFSDNKNDYIYKTGDLGRKLLDDQVELVGRADHQVKIRGVRMELSEIENHLLKHPLIQEAAVIAKEDEENNKFLVAFYVSKNGLVIPDLRQHVLRELSENMVPSFFVMLELIPLNKNGKIDRKKLALWDIQLENDIEYVEPTNDIERKLSEMWLAIFNREKVSIDQDFFEIGGHSLRAAKLMTEIFKEFGVEIPLKVLFEKTTIRQQSQYIMETDSKVYKEIPIIQEKDYYEASSAQKRIYLLQQFDTRSTAYNLPYFLLLEGKVDKNRIEHTINEVIRRHETLRTSFETREGEIIQRVSNDIELKLMYTEVQNEEEIDGLIASFVQPFDLGRAPLIRIQLVKQAAERYILFFDMHHIISDATSIGRFIYEFATIYEGHQLGDLRIQYKDFAAWHNGMLRSEDMKDKEQFWIDCFTGELPVLHLPTDFVRPTIKSFEGDQIRFSLDAEVTAQLRKINSQSGSTMYMVLLATINILLAKYTGQEDIIIGSPVAGRSYADLENMIGMFVNTLPMRNQPMGEKYFDEFLDEVCTNAFDAYENQDYPFEELVDQLQLNRDLSRNPLFDVMFTMQNTESKSFSFQDFRLSEYKQVTNMSKFDLSFSAMEIEESIEFHVEYCTKLFKRETIEKMGQHLINIIQEIIAQPHCKIRDIDILSKEEKTLLLEDFNKNYVEYPHDKTVQELFMEQVQKTPHHIAVIYEDQKLTYQELDEKSNQIANALLEKGIQKEDLVGIYFERSIDMLTAILGVWKAGGAYIPIDIQYPMDRVCAMLHDSKAKIIMTKSKHIKEQSSFYSVLTTKTNLQHILYLDSCELVEKETPFASISDASYLQNCSKEKIENRNSPSDLCYVIYTSGSSGKPKGAMIEHRGMVNHLFAKIHDLKMSENSRVVQNASHCFDISVWQFLSALMCGGTTLVYSNELILDSEKLIKKVIVDQVTILEVVPSYLHVMLTYLEANRQDLGQLEYLLVTGEELKPKLVKRWFDLYSEIKLVNAYGPTEASDDITHHILTSYSNEEKIPVGKPIQNLKIYVVDSYMKLCPMGVKGEIVVAGIGVGRGYLFDEEKTKNAFMQNPFSNSQERLYKTGDLGYWNPDGTLGYLGRKDYQVKIRGHRVELGEIESVINKLNEVKEAVVLIKGEDVQKQYLCAYLMLHHDQIEKVKMEVKEKLPDFMVPSSYVVLNQFPLTDNGKIDRKALLEIQEENNHRSKVPPRSFYDQAVVDIWKNVLETEEVYVDDDFFDLGGSSIHLIQVVNQMKAQLGIELSFADLMVYKTVGELAEYISTLNSDGNFLKNVFKINKSTSNKNIFIIHGAGGDIFLYRDLASLLEDEYSVYGVQPKGLSGNETLPRSYYEMIHDYIKEIRMVQNEGPYIIAGYCMGGIVSYDIVKIFEMQGEEVAALIELDHEAYMKKGIYELVMRFNNVVIKSIEYWRKIRGKDKSYTTEKFSKMMLKLKPISRERQLEILKNAENLKHFFGRELVNKTGYFSLGYISSPTLLIKGKENNHKLLKAELWRTVLKGSLDFHEVPGDHDTVLKEPNVERVAGIIKEYLKKRI